MVQTYSMLERSILWDSNTFSPDYIKLSWLRKIYVMREKYERASCKPNMLEKVGMLLCISTFIADLTFRNRGNVSYRSPL